MIVLLSFHCTLIETIKKNYRETNRLRILSKREKKEKLKICKIKEAYSPESW